MEASVTGDFRNYRTEIMTENLGDLWHLHH